jgi:CheY-like chemotaxis protein
MMADVSTFGLKQYSKMRMMETPKPGRSLRILLAEDTESIRVLIEHCLTRVGHSVESLADGSAAVERFALGRFDVVVLDMRMPIMDGYTAARKIREIERAGKVLSPVSIIALTANLQPSEIARSQEAGCTAYLGKPFSKEDLLALVAQADVAAEPRPDGSIAVHPDPEIADMIPIFLAHQKRDIPLITAAIGRGDYKAAADFGHRTAGAGGSYGFPEISAIARRIEQAAKGRDGARVLHELKELAEHLKRLTIAND